MRGSSSVLKCAVDSWRMLLPVVVPCSSNYLDSELTLYVGVYSALAWLSDCNDRRGLEVSACGSGPGGSEFVSRHGLVNVRFGPEY